MVDNPAAKPRPTVYCDHCDVVLDTEIARPVEALAQELVETARAEARGAQVAADAKEVEAIADAATAATLEVVRRAMLTPTGLRIEPVAELVVVAQNALAEWNLGRSPDRAQSSPKSLEGGGVTNVGEKGGGRECLICPECLTLVANVGPGKCFCAEGHAEAECERFVREDVAHMFAMRGMAPGYWKTEAMRG
jgi:hypothetical protein